MVFNNIKDKLPTEEGQYLVIINFMKRSFYEVAKFTLDLSKINKHDSDLNGKSGFYGYEDDWGYFVHKDIVAWAELPEIPKEFRE
jgi:hypothetical protein